MLQIENLAWDSSFFNLKIGKILVSHEIDFNILNNFLQKNTEHDLIYIFSNHEIEGYKSILVDKKARFVLRNKEINQTKASIIAEEYQSNEVNKSLLELTFQSGQHSRFLLDSKLGKEKFEELYRIWIERSVKKEIANKVYVTQYQNQLAGFVTEGINGNEMNIGLIATDEKYRGKGIGKALIQQVLNDFGKSEQELLSVYTQLDNKNACAFYEKCGFNLENIEYIYHYWK